jgi:hypothetical protein
MQRRAMRFSRVTLADVNVSGPLKDRLGVSKLDLRYQAIALVLEHCSHGAMGRDSRQLPKLAEPETNFHSLGQLALIDINFGQAV